MKMFGQVLQEHTFDQGGGSISSPCQVCKQGIEYHVEWYTDWAFDGATWIKVESRHLQKELHDQSAHEADDRLRKLLA